MWPFKRVPKPSPLRLVDLDNRLSEVETAVAWLRKANTDLNARVTTVQRRADKPAAAAETEVDPALAAPRVTQPLSERAEQRRRLRGF